MFAYEQTEIRDQSVFTPDGATHYLEWDETLLRLTFEGQQTVEITSTTVSTELSLLRHRLRSQTISATTAASF